MNTENLKEKMKFYWKKRMNLKILMFKNKIKKKQILMTKKLPIRMLEDNGE